ncbi:PIR Superfamily Protein [Plasmodium ovale wallikeri]|uniref:PIR Superfamily Protein n=2 Tax=Plasmodium ovale TaxID=36330 RepID=A0A1A9A659_PLAOA|nr:PIR Superfamily Protein [Plasmodium ovale wallikeri]SBT54111.1 PIR Superfamily Protein [Plasmodium ovale wallikeri]SBT74443.1 Plasmodium vivax Vir protein, putative [Plasmodium ovale]
MPLEIQTIYNAAYSNCIFKNKLDSYKNNGELKNNDSCSDFTNSHLITKGNKQNICKAVILFFKDLNDQTYEFEGTKHEDTVYRDNGCKIYTQHHDNLNTLVKYINEMNKHTSDKLVRLTNLYNELDDFFTKNEKEKPECIGNFIDTYNNYVDECRRGNGNDFCNELKNFRKKYNFYIENVIKCRGEQYLLPPVESSDIGNTPIIPFSLIPIVSLILPILYKFTAFGPWIRNIIGKNRNVWNNMNEEPDQLLNIYEIEDDNSNMQNYNIAYNSS